MAGAAGRLTVAGAMAFALPAPGERAPHERSAIDRRIRVGSGDDPGRERTDEIVFVTDFLRAIPGVVIYDPRQQRDLVAA